MKKIVIIPNPKKDTDFSVTQKAAEILIGAGASVYIENKFAEVVASGCVYYESFPTDAELIAVIGGDGSMLDASVIAVERDIPLVGINLGKVGYLSEVEPDNIDVLEKIILGEYRIYDKMLLTVTKNGAEGQIVSDRYAVNDVVISHDSYLGISEFTVCTSEGGLRYRADGIIFSTPAGSTAYSFSAGGPIVSHEVDAILATPVCPHSFFDRSILFGGKDRIALKNTADDKLNISVDGRCFASLTPGEECEIRAAKRRLKVLSFKDSNMFSQLFKKMRVMEDVK